MALSDRDIIIAPSRGTAVEPVTTYRGGDAASSGTITLRVLNSGTSAILSFEGNTGQLLSISDVPSSTVFSANDISGVPSIEVLDTGQVKIAEYNGFLSVGGAANQENATSTSTGELRVVGGASVWKDLVVGGTITAASFSGTINNATNVAVTDASSDGTTHYPILATGTSGNQGLRADSSLQYIPSTNRLGIGVSPSYSLDVAAQANPFQTVARFGSGGSDILITHASAIISHNASYNGSWTRTGSGRPTQIELQSGIFNVQNSVTSGAGGSAITDWVSRLYIENDGDVGIGTTGPSYKLHVIGDIYANGGSLRVSGTNGLYFESYGGGWFMQDTSWVRTTNSKNVWTGTGLLGTDGGLTSGYGGAAPPTGGAIIAGNVGIGQSSAGRRLVVAGTGTGNYEMQVGGGSPGQAATLDVITNHDSRGFQVWDDNNLSTPRFVVQRDGRVGINTTSPSVSFHNVGAGILANNTGIDPDTYPNTVIAGAISDTSWGITSGIAGNAGAGDSWAIGHNGNYLYFGVGNASADNTLATYMVAGGASRHLWLVPPSAAGSVGIGIAEGTTPGRKLDVNGVANFRSHIAQTIDHSRPDVQWGATSGTGAVIIYLPGNTGNYGMIHCVIDIYTYDGENASTIIVGGHNWNSAWYNFGSTRVGNFSKGVRVGVKNGQYCIVLGTNTSSWSYGQVRVRKIQNGSYYSGIMDLSGSYTITLDGAAESYTYISSNLITGGSSGWNSGNDGAGSGLDADLLDGIDSTSFVRDDAASSGYIQLDGGGQNAPLDATLYVTATNNNDWLMRLNAQNSSKTEYGAYVAIPSSATYAWAVQTNSSSFNWRINGSGHSFSPIYYDVDDTARFMDMNGSNTSQIGTLRLNGDWGAATGNAALTIRGTFPSIALRATNGSTPVWMLHNDAGSTLYWYNQQGAVDGTSWDWRWSVNSSGTMIATGDVRAPIFYDYNNTSYYLDPNVGSGSIALRLNQGFIQWDSGSATMHDRLVMNGGFNVGEYYRIRWRDGTNGIAAIRGGFAGTGTSQGGQIQFGDFWWNFTHGNGTVWPIVMRPLSTTAATVEVTSGDMRAPIFYDYNNTGFYLDPAGTSVLNIVQTNSSITSSNAMYAPIYYDSNDNNYWVDPNSISKVSMMQAENLGGAVMNRVTSNIGISGSGVNEAIGFIDGTTVQAHVSTGNGNSGACYQWYTTEWIYVDPEKDYEFSYWVRSTGNDAIYFGWHELNSAGNYISSNPYFSGSSINTNGTWVKRVALLRNWRTPSGQANSDGTDRYASTTSRNSGPDVQDGVMHSNTRRVHLRFGTCYGSVNGSKTYFHLASIREVTGHDRQAQTITLPYFNGSSWQGSMNFRSRTHWDNISGIDIIGGAGEFRMSSDTGELNLRVDGWVYGTTQMQTPIIYDLNDTAYYLDPNSTSRLWRPNSDTQQRWNMHFRGIDNGAQRPSITGDSNYWTTTLGWGTGYGTWATYWQYGFGGFDCWGSSTDHPQGAGYVHAQGIQSGLHYATSGGGQGYGWQMVGAADADSRWWLRGKWGTTTRPWYEVVLFGRNVGGDLYANIMYDSGNTNFYVDPASQSNQYRVRVGPYAGSNSSGNVTGLELINTGGTGDGNVAAMSYHCSGYYGMHQHLRHDGYFGVGGWSASTWRWYVYMVNGTMTAAGDVVAYSDPRLKEEITPITNALEKVLSLNGMRFKWKNTSVIGRPGEYDYGILSTEVKKVAPELVHDSVHEAPEGDRYNTVAYDKIIPFLIEAIREQNANVVKLQQEVEQLKAVNKFSLTQFVKNIFNKILGRN